MAQTDTITVYRGEDRLIEVTMEPVVDITGWTLLLSVHGVGETIFTKDGTITSAENGTFTFTLADDDTAELRPGRYTYDVWRTDSGSERVVAIGEFIITDVARDVVP